MNTPSEKFLRQRKFLLLLPLMTLPFITLAFWALGGGPGTKQQEQVRQQGLNTSLPSPQLTDSTLDKMSLYKQAGRDTQSVQPQAGTDSSGSGDSTAVNEQFGKGGYAGNSASEDANEAKIRSKLAHLEQVVRQQQSAESFTTPGPANATGDQDATKKTEQLQQMMQNMGQDNAPDPEMQQLNGMLEKILDIQHPDRVQQQLREESLKNKGRVYTVTKPDFQPQAALLQNADTAAKITRQVLPAFAQGNAFYDIRGNGGRQTAVPPAIAAVVHESQTVVTGSTIKMRLTDDVFISGVLIPKNNFLFGTCSVDGERLKITISGIRYQNNLFPVSLSVYDPDALEGIRVPGAISRDASKEGAERGIQGVQFMSLDPSLATQAAGVGLETAKGLFSKKVKLIRVTVKAGYPVLLMDAKAKQNNN